MYAIVFGQEIVRKLGFLAGFSDFGYSNPFARGMASDFG